MNTVVHIKLKYLLLFMVVIFVFLKFCSSNNPILEGEKTTTTIEKIVVEKQDSVQKNDFLNIEGNQITIALDTTNNKIRKLTTKKTFISKNNKEKLVDVVEYKDTIQLKNGKIFSSILVDPKCKIYSQSSKLFTSDIHTIKTTLTERNYISTPNAFYLYYKRDYSIKGFERLNPFNDQYQGINSLSMISQEVGIDYVFWNGKMIAGTSFGRSELLPKGSQGFVSVKVGIKIFGK
jgi:hypothetical protein